jgi:hypothetical protein
MQTYGSLVIGRSLLVIAIALAAACADGTKKMTTLPKEGGAGRGNEAHTTVVLFKVEVEEDGKPIPGILSTVPRWKWHYRVNVGGTNKPLDLNSAFAAGLIDSTAAATGWGFVTLPPGTHQLAFAAFRTRFAMPGARRGALGYGQSSASRVEVPDGVNLLYIGTFFFGCRKADRWWGYVERECTQLQVSNEEELARDVASTLLTRFGALQTVLASTAPADPSR